MFNLPMNPMNMALMGGQNPTFPTMGPATPPIIAPAPPAAANNMQAFFNNPLTSIGMGMLAGNRGRNPFANAMAGGMRGMQQAQVSQQKQLQAEAMKQQMLLAKQQAEKQAEMEKKMEEWVTKTRPDLVNAPEYVKKQAFKEMFAGPKVHSLSPGAQLVDAQGNVIARTPFKPQAEGSRARESESIQLANTIATMSDEDPRKAMLQQRLMHMSGVKNVPGAVPTASGQSPTQVAPTKQYSKSEQAKARESLSKAQNSLEIIRNLKTKIQASGNELVGVRGKARQLFEGPVANVFDLDLATTPATDVSQDIGVLQSNARVPLTGPGNTATAEWERINKQIQGDDLRSSGPTALKALEKLEKYMQDAVKYNAPIAGENVEAVEPGASAKAPSQADLEFTAKKHNMTVEQVKQKLGIK